MFNHLKTFHFEFDVLNYFNNFKENRFSSKNVTLPGLKQIKHVLNEHTHFQSKSWIFPLLIDISSDCKFYQI